MKKYLLISILVMAFGSQGFAQSKTVENFSKKADGYTAFLYQSVIRMMNKDKNPDFNMLIRNLDHIRVLTTEPGAGDPKSTFKSLDKGVQAEGFEEIMTFDNKDYRCHVYELATSGNKSTWVATLYMNDAAGIIEMKGSLDVKYFRAFSSLDMDKLQELVPLEKN
ncbi:MAG: DUF4252 domain-containing protein [Bacteroidota bacterium]